MISCPSRSAEKKSRGQPRQVPEKRKSARSDSCDGSYGLTPDAGGNFTGVTAHGGLRWVAGWSAATEIFGQTLASPLVAGRTYRIGGFFHMAQRSDLRNAGSYQVSLAADTSRTDEEILGTFCLVNVQRWEPRSFTFVAPANAASLPVLIFTPVRGIAHAYPGVDDLTLTDVTPCS